MLMGSHPTAVRSAHYLPPGRSRVHRQAGFSGQVDVSTQLGFVKHKLSGLSPHRL